MRFPSMEAKAMAPSIHIEVPPESKATKVLAETVVLETRKGSSTPSRGTVPVSNRPDEGSFQSSMLEYNRMKSGNKWVNMLVSLTINCTVLMIPILLALYFTDTLDLKQFASTFLVAPPPPPPPPPPPAVVQVVRVKPMAHLMEAGKLVAPRVIPKEIKIIKEDPQAPDVGGGVAGGVPGGVAGGSMSGVIGGVIGGTSTIAQPLAPKREGPKAPVRVGGRVKEPRILQRIDPIYPPLAKQTHLQGTVVIDAIIDEHGQIVEMKVVSGPPLLIQAAIDAVSKWRYEPTYLNEEPVPVQLNVNVTFRLSE
jgi:periplasmic protein TonB